MNTHDEILRKYDALPPALQDAVSRYIDFLLITDDTRTRELFDEFRTTVELEGDDFADYLDNLERYERALSRGDAL